MIVKGKEKEKEKEKEKKKTKTKKKKTIPKPVCLRACPPAPRNLDGRLRIPGMGSLLSLCGN